MSYYHKMQEIKEKQQYNDLWKKYKFSILQSWEWGEIKSKEWKVKRLAIKDIPVTILYKKFPIFNFKFGYIPRGFSNSILDQILLEELIDYTKKELDLTHLVIDPNLTKNIEIFSKSGFKSTGKTIQPNQTNIIDLTKSQEELWQDLSSSMKRIINKARKNNCEVEIKKDPEEALKIFLEMNSGINARNNYSKFSDSYYRRVWENLHPKSMAEILVIKHQNENIGAYFVAYAGETTYEWYGGLTNTGKKLKAGPLLKWESIMEAKRRGLKIYDQWGVAKKIGPGQEDFAKDDQFYYISIFKTRFGGTYKQFLPQQTIILKPLQYRIYQFGEFLIRLKLKFKR